ncbi:MAG: VOC family protein [Hyphomicrobiaceae bacterium]
MKLSFHHVNLSTPNVERLDVFYREVMGLASAQQMASARVKDEGYPGAVSFLTDGATQFHIAERDLEVGYRTRKGINPVERGHLAFRTDDISAFKARLEAQGIPFADFGDWAMTGWQQIFFYDPDGNVVEVHEVDEEAAKLG